MCPSTTPSLSRSCTSFAVAINDCHMINTVYPTNLSRSPVGSAKEEMYVVNAATTSPPNQEGKSGIGLTKFQPTNMPRPNNAINVWKVLYTKSGSSSLFGGKIVRSVRWKKDFICCAKRGTKYCGVARRRIKRINTPNARKNSVQSPRKNTKTAPITPAM